MREEQKLRETGKVIKRITFTSVKGSKYHGQKLHKKNWKTTFLWKWLLELQEHFESVG